MQIDISTVVFAARGHFRRLEAALGARDTRPDAAAGDRRPPGRAPRPPPRGGEVIASSPRRAPARPPPRARPLEGLRRAGHAGRRRLDAIAAAEPAFAADSFLAARAPPTR